MILDCRDETSTCPAGNHFAVGLHGEIEFHPDKAGRFSNLYLFRFVHFFYLVFIVGKAGSYPTFYRSTVLFSKIPPFLEIQVVSIYRRIGKTKYRMTLLTHLYIISTHLNFGRIFTEVVKCKLDIMPLNVFWSIL